MQVRKHGLPWTPVSFGVLLTMIALAMFAERHVFADILMIGTRDEEQSHILLVPFVALWLFWLRRSRLRFVRVRPSLVGPGVVLAGALFSWWGFTSGTQVAWHGGAGLVVLGALLSMTGLEPIRQFAPAIVVLAFAVPVPGVIRTAIAMPLQGMATSITQSMLELMGITALRLGNVLVINGEQIAVGEACNGMRLVFAFTLVVYAFVFSTPLKPATRVVMLVATPVTALVSNVIRLVPTSLIYGYGTADRAEWFHDVTGWIMLPIAFILLLAVLRIFRWLDVPVTSFRLAVQ